MHHGIMVKVKADNKEHATEQTSDLIRETICCTECQASVREINWDYFDIIDFVDKAWIKKNREELYTREENPVRTPEELALYYHEEWLPAEQKRVAKQLKEELDKVQKAFDETGLPPENTWADYLFQTYDQIMAVIKWGSADQGIYVLHCTDNHYADLTEMTSGKKEFYLWVDRHY